MALQLLFWEMFDINLVKLILLTASCDIIHYISTTGNMDVTSLKVQQLAAEINKLTLPEAKQLGKLIDWSQIGQQQAPTVSSGEKDMGVLFGHLRHFYSKFFAHKAPAEPPSVRFKVPLDRDIQRIRDLGCEGVIALLGGEIFGKVKRVDPIRTRSKVVKLEVFDEEAKGIISAHLCNLASVLGVSRILLLPDLYHVVARNFRFKRHEIGDDALARWRKYNDLRHLSDARISFGFLTLTLTDKAEARQLCLRRVVLDNQVGYVEPIDKRGVPLFCVRCSRPGHLKDQCDHEALCGLCSGTHQSMDSWASGIHEKPSAKKPNSTEEGASVSERKSTFNTAGLSKSFATLTASSEKGKATDNYTAEKTVEEEASQATGSLDEGSVTTAVVTACNETAPKSPIQGSSTLPTDVESEVSNGKNGNQVQSQGEPNDTLSDSPKQLIGTKRRRQHNNDTPAKRRFQSPTANTRRPVGRPKLPQPAAQTNTIDEYWTTRSQSTQSQNLSEIPKGEPEVAFSEEAQKDNAEGGSNDSQDSNIGEDIHESDFLDEEE
ncbi:hypothetical protein LY76DRAFT_640279 [Colletotrichum caudatum]|nr:hypothetical protein LY76DRAFT_640279 [Colletotrichum caudatum]